MYKKADSLEGRSGEEEEEREALLRRVLEHYQRCLDIYKANGAPAEKIQSAEAGVAVAYADLGEAALARARGLGGSGDEADEAKREALLKAAEGHYQRSLEICKAASPGAPAAQGIPINEGQLAKVRAELAK